MEFGTEYIYKAEDGEEEFEEIYIHQSQLTPQPYPFQDPPNIPQPYAFDDDFYDDDDMELECEGIDFDPTEDDIGHEYSNAQVRRVPVANLNTLLFQFNKLESTEEPPEETLTPAQAVVCGNNDCKAYLSFIDTAEPGSSPDKKVWKCKFCGRQNDVANDVTVPQKQDVIYQEISASAQMEATPTPISEDKRPCIIFVIDTSSSMGVTRQVGDRHISRLRSLQDAVDQYIKEMKINDSNTCVGLISFSSQVVIYSDGTIDEIIISKEGDLYDQDLLTATAFSIPPPGPLKLTSEALTMKLKKLEEKGQTALGPAMVAALSIARNPGSKVILCTDGLANIGVGNLEVNDASRRDAEKFYADLGAKAKETGVLVSVLTIEGTSCELNLLRNMVENTGGDVAVVSKILAEKFKAIPDLLATNAIATFITNVKMYVRDRNDKDNQKHSRFVEDIGNVSSVTKTTFDYAFKQTPPSDNTKPDPKPADNSGTTQPPVAPSTPAPSGAEVTPNSSAQNPQGQDVTQNAGTAGSNQTPAPSPGQGNVEATGQASASSTSQGNAPTSDCSGGDVRGEHPPEKGDNQSPNPQANAGGVQGSLPADKSSPEDGSSVDPPPQCGDSSKDSPMEICDQQSTTASTTATAAASANSTGSTSGPVGASPKLEDDAGCNIAPAGFSCTPGLMSGTSAAVTSIPAGTTTSTPASTTTPTPAGTTTSTPAGTTTTTSASGSAPAGSENQTPWPEEELPFQLQVEYRNLMGVLKTRVWTQARYTTRDKNRAKKDVNSQAIVTSALQAAGMELQKDDKEKAASTLSALINQLKNSASSALVPTLQSLISFITSQNCKGDKLAAVVDKLTKGDIPKDFSENTMAGMPFGSMPLLQSILNPR